MNKLFIDIETTSDQDIKHGVHKYTDTPAFDILTICYKRDGKPTRELDLENADAFVEMLQDADTIKIAHNAEFEIRCLEIKYNITLDITQWRCTSAQARRYNYPASLHSLGALLGNKKMEEGKDLIKKFCSSPASEIDKTSEDWKTFVDYCKQDVEVCVEIHDSIPELTKYEQECWEAVVSMNRKGIRIDTELVDAIIARRDANNEALTSQFEININSRKQVLEYCDSIGEKRLRGYTKADIEAFLQLEDIDPTLAKMLEARQETGAIALKKMEAIKESMCSDGRVHDTYIYCGTESLRTTNVEVNLQNLARPVHAFEEIELASASNQELKDLIRGCFIASEGCDLHIADFSQIEARVFAHLVGDEDTLNAYKAGEDIYKKQAALMHRVPEAEITKEQRSQGKVATLACGYQGGPTALINMGKNYGMHVSDDDAYLWVQLWRRANPKITEFWNAIETACKRVVACVGSTLELSGLRVRSFVGLKGITLEITNLLDSKLYFHNIDPSLTYDCYRGRTTERKQLYGGMLAARIVSSSARDIMMLKMIEFQDVVITVYDEIVIDSNTLKLGSVEAKMTESIGEIDYLACSYEVSKRYKK